MENIKQLLTWAKQAQEIFKKAEETDFSELKRKDKNAILEAILDTDYDYDTDGDTDGVCLFYHIGNISVIFSGHGETGLPDDLLDHLDDIEIHISDDDASIDDLAKYLGQRISGGTKMVNLTPHAITFYARGSNTILQTVPSSGLTQVEQKQELIDVINGIPVSQISYGAVEGLPDSVPGTIYIVSALTVQVVSGRNDLYITDDVVLDAGGKILGYRALTQIYREGFY